MLVEIKNIRGCEYAKFPVDGIVLIAGKNGAAKSSIAKAMGLVITGLVPSKERLARMVKTGNGSGSVAITDGGQGSSIEIPSQTAVEGTGWPQASKYAAGLVRFSEEKSAEQSTILQKLLETEPGEIDLANELKKNGVSEENIAAVWATVKRRGWDDAHKFYAERGRELKAQWDQIAGEKYGEKKAANWTPKEWESDLDGLSEQTLIEQLAQQTETLEELIRFEAVNDELMNQVKEEWLGLEPAKTEREECKAEEARLEAQFKKLNDELKALPRPSASIVTQACPHCKGELIAPGGKIQIPPPRESTEEAAARLKAIAEKQAEIDELGPRLSLAQNATMAASLKVNACEKAGQKHMELLKQEKGQAVSQKQVEAARQAVSRAKSRLESFRLKSKAEAKHESIESNQLIIDTLRPDGFRQKHTNEALLRFNQDYLTAQCEIAGFPLVKIDRNLNITMDGRLYDDLSDGEKYRVNAVFQTALARIQQADLLVFDGADILDSDGRRGLFQMIRSVGLKAVVTMTTRREQTPNLSKMGIGVTYWLEHGRLEKLEA